MNAPENAVAWLQRFRNAARKMRAGLPLFGESVSPEIPNDVFVAHASIYDFFAKFVVQKTVIDLGCGAGYGADIMADAGARHVTAVDLHGGNIRYARKHASNANVTFEIGDIENLTAPSDSVDVAVSSNVFEHLSRVDRALAHVVRVLRSNGTFLLAVPPITDAAGLEDNRRNPYHRSNFFVHEWYERLNSLFQFVSIVAHLPPDGIRLDFANAYPSAVQRSAFRFEPRTLTAFPGPDVLTALFVCEQPNRPSAPLNDNEPATFS